MKNYFSLVCALGLSLTSLSAQFSISSLNTNLTVDDFNSFTGAGFSPTPSPGQLNSNSWSTAGWSDGSVAFGGTGTTGDFARGTSTGGVGTGGIYAFDIGGGDFILGVQPGGSDFAPGNFTLRLQNNTGSTIGNLTVDYDIAVFNNADRSSAFNFSHSSDNSSFSDIGSLDFITSEAADVSPAWASIDRNTTITGVSIADGSSYFLRWSSNDVGGSGSRDEFGLNNISINASAIPEPSTYALIFGGLALGVVLWRKRAKQAA